MGWGFWAGVYGGKKVADSVVDTVFGAIEHREDRRREQRANRLPEGMTQADRNRVMLRRAWIERGYRDTDPFEHR